MFTVKPRTGAPSRRAVVELAAKVRNDY